ncbi:MAG: neutral/alkaline non-lysosomal ceramidase N-terminal domain-containing protein [Gemmatimonadota bacterium]
MTRRPAVLVGSLLLAGCANWHSQPLPMPASRPVAPSHTLRAGFAQVDITPPPGVGLGGTGPEDRRSTGYRTRLYVRALVLEDPTGERIALVVADLPHVSSNLHRLAADQLLDSTGIGADRLIISATHTHSSLANFYAERQYNVNVSRVVGYDPRIVDYLVRSIVEAVEAATASLRPALVAVGETSILGATTNRSFDAFCLNQEYQQDPICDSRNLAPGHGVDTTLVMIRVDDRDTRKPMGSYSVFAIHGTAVPSLNTLLDGDVHVRVVAGLTDHVGSGTVNILANGTEGDVAPLVERDQSCDPPRLGLSEPVLMPLGPSEEFDFVEPTAATSSRCVATALERLEVPVSLITQAAARLFDDLAGSLRDDLPIRRAFTTVWLPGTDGLCIEPVEGSSTSPGAEAMTTRVEGWDWVLFPLIRLAAMEGGAAIKPVSGECQSPKRTLLGLLQGPFVVGEHGLPETAQLTVVRIGDALFASVPAEITTALGRHMKSAMARSASGWTPRYLAVIGLADGFLQYVTTEAEYQRQDYEGGSNLYGPNTGAFLVRRLGDLAARIPGSDRVASPPVEIGPITAYPGPPSSIMASPTAGPEVVKDLGVTLVCEAGRLGGHWLDLAPGRLFPRQQSLLELWQETAPASWARVARDGDGQLEVQLGGNRKGRGFEWTTTWRGVPGGHQYRLVRVGDDSAGDRVSNEVLCP